MIISITLMSNMEENINKSLKEVMKNAEQYIRYRLIIDEVGLNSDGLKEDSEYILKYICGNYECSNRLSDMNGKILQNNTSKSLENIIENGVNVSKKGKAVVNLNYSKNNLYGILSYPIYEGGNYIGITTIVKDYSEIYNSSRDIVKFITIIEVTVFLAVFILVFIVISKITKLITILTSAAIEVGAGRYDFDIKIKSKDEVGILAREFINMKNKIKEQMTTIRLEKEKVEKLEKGRIEFFNNVTHELKTPLTSISGYAQMLISGLVEEEAFNKRAIGRIYSESERLHSLVLKLIDVSKGNSFVKEELTQISMYKLLNEICDDMSIKAIKYSIVINKDIQDGIILGQINRIRELVINILDNAIKYSVDSSQITVSANIEGDYYNFEVTNKSEPIPDNIYNKIFEPFVKSQKTKENQSLGLGLYICSEIIKEHNGKISIENGNYIKVNIKIPMTLE
jgi:signal transduction histidine kinase